jgi:hypothetical protein
VSPGDWRGVSWPVRVPAPAPVVVLLAVPVVLLLARVRGQGLPAKFPLTWRRDA